MKCEITKIHLYSLAFFLLITILGASWVDLAKLVATHKLVVKG